MDNRNTIIAVVLSMLVLVGWQYFFSRQHITKPAAETTQTGQQAVTNRPANAPAPAGGTATPTASPAAMAATRDAAIAASPRVPIDTPRLFGSIALRGARLDDLSLRDYRTTVEPSSPNIVLLEPASAPAPFYAQQGFVNAAGGSLKLPDDNSEWTAATQGALSPSNPVTLTWDNGAGLVFRRTFSVDDQYMFTVGDEVRNDTGAEVKLHPYALISRHGTPVVAGYYILHEGLIGVTDGGLDEVKYSAIAESKQTTYKGAAGGWVGITDKYWAATVIPPQTEPFTARFSATTDGTPTYQTDYMLDAKTIPAGGTLDVSGQVFAGAKVVGVVDAYKTALGIKQFDLLIDWGWFYFITKPMFYSLDFFYHLVGNFGLAILIVTVLVKLIFFPLANKSYVSMSKMKLIQPELAKMKERFGDDRLKQQQAMMDLYKREKINPVAGCLPIVIQIPVFFSLYKVLFVTIEMRHAPFFGWIKDLSAPDPTSLFNLFGLIPWDVPHVMMIGVWPLIMGFTMFLQMRLNPPPPDPTQAMIFNWMPLIFMFMLASFPAGLVIYWSWNNALSVTQQYIIMRRQGVDVDLWGNVKQTFGRKPKPQS